MKNINLSKLFNELKNEILFDNVYKLVKKQLIEDINNKKIINDFDEIKLIEAYNESAASGEAPDEFYDITFQTFRNDKPVQKFAYFVRPKEFYNNKLEINLYKYS